MKLPDDWIVPEWSAPANVRALITARGGGTSVGPYASFNLGDLTADDPDAVAENKRRLAALVPGPIRWLRQVHGSRVIHADDVAPGIEADGSFTRASAVVCAVKIADCMPVLVADKAGTAVGIAHAGWRGLSGGVVENTVAAMQVPPERLVAYLGPAIGPDTFEVGGEVREAFCDVDLNAAAAFKSHRTGKWLADLFMLGRQRLARCGVREVHGGGMCTFSAPERFYSHRRNPVTGRMAALIWLDAGGS